MVKDVVEPGAGRRTEKEVIVVGEDLPHRARVGVDGATVAAGNPELVECDPLRVQHPEDVVIRRDQEGCRLRERFVVGQQRRRHVPVRTNERQVLDLVEEFARDAAPLAGHYPAMRIGPAWWFHDSIEGMRRYKENLVETAGIYNLAGFNDDTRAFLSIPARHDLARRIDANSVAGLVARHPVDMSRIGR